MNGSPAQYGLFDIEWDIPLGDTCIPHLKVFGDKYFICFCREDGGYTLVLRQQMVAISNEERIVLGRENIGSVLDSSSCVIGALTNHAYRYLRSLFASPPFEHDEYTPPTLKVERNDCTARLCYQATIKSPSIIGKRLVRVVSHKNELEQQWWFSGLQQPTVALRQCIGAMKNIEYARAQDLCPLTLDSEKGLLTVRPQGFLQFGLFLGSKSRVPTPA